MSKALKVSNTLDVDTTLYATLVEWDRAPLVPVTETVTTMVPSLVKVQERLEVGESLKTVEGARVHAEFSAVRVTVPEKPFREDRVIVEVPGESTRTVTAVGVAEIVKSGGAVTLKSTETEWDREPLVPVTMTVTTPVAVKLHDSVEEPEPPVTVTGVNVQAELSAVSATSPTNPLTGETVIEEVPGEPTVVVTVAGVAMIMKSARPVTV